jgi:hypothetical protein
MSATSSRSSRATPLTAVGLPFLSVRPWKCYAFVANGDFLSFLFIFDVSSGFRENCKAFAKTLKIYKSFVNRGFVEYVAKRPYFFNTGATFSTRTFSSSLELSQAAKSRAFRLFLHFFD